MNKARFLTDEDLIVMPFECRMDSANDFGLVPTNPHISTYEEPMAYLNGVWCHIKRDAQNRWYGDPENPENPRHPEEADE
jgi:hypothetical protein